jgi:hypothetical protein
MTATDRAFVSFLMLNDSFLPGVLEQAYELAEHAQGVSRVCLITDDISAEARSALEVLFHHVVAVETVFVPHKRRHERQDRPFLLTRLQALRLGPGGDLGFGFRKIVLLDADIMPLKRYDQLFLLDTPAGILNERKEHFVATDGSGRYEAPSDVDITGRWVWHDIYGDVGHGARVPKEYTDRVKRDRGNLGVNTALMVLEPSASEFDDIQDDIRRPETLRFLSEEFDWPDMQYLTMRWSGRWVNVDASFCGFCGYPSLASLCGTHFAGVKPWGHKNTKSWRHYSRFPDFRYWQRRFLECMAEHPELGRVRRLARLAREIRALETSLRPLPAGRSRAGEQTRIGAERRRTRPRGLN